MSKEASPITIGNEILKERDRVSNASEMSKMEGGIGKGFDVRDKNYMQPKCDKANVVNNKRKENSTDTNKN